MAKVAFELRADQKDFSGGTTSLVDGEAFDVGAALKEGGGTITLNPDPGERKDEAARVKEDERAFRDRQIVEALDSYPALKRAEAPKGGTS